MSPKKQEQLYKKYTEIFAQKDSSMQETCMCWGISCGDGWFRLLDNLCDYITTMCKNNGWRIPQAIQIKEKWGCLRFYTDAFEPESTDSLEGAIMFTEFLSSVTCEKCGTADKVKLREAGWIHIYCDKCEKQYKKDGKK